MFSYLVSTTGPTMVGLGETKLRLFRWLEKAVLKLELANTVFHKNTILQILKQNLQKVW